MLVKGATGIIHHVSNCFSFSHGFVLVEATPALQDNFSGTGAIASMSVNTLWLNDAMRRYRTGTALAQVMTILPDVTKLLPELMFTYHHSVLCHKRISKQLFLTSG